MYSRSRIHKLLCFKVPYKPWKWNYFTYGLFLKNLYALITNCGAAKEYWFEFSTMFCAYIRHLFVSIVILVFTRSIYINLIQIIQNVSLFINKYIVHITRSIIMHSWYLYSLWHIITLYISMCFPACSYAIN